MIKIETITPDAASVLCRKITVDLPEYFGLPEVNEHYADLMQNIQSLWHEQGELFGCEVF